MRSMPIQPSASDIIVSNICDINPSDDDLMCLVNILSLLAPVDIDRADISRVRAHINALAVESHVPPVNKKYILVALHRGQIVGTGSLLVEQKIIHGMGKTAHLEDLVVSKSYQGTGVAGILIKSLKQLAHQHQCYKVILNASDSLRIFYIKHGFVLNSNGMRCSL